ncbi:hypothetical protein Tco_0451683 [Tanacetum coccineum]
MAPATRTNSTTTEEILACLREPIAQLMREEMEKLREEMRTTAMEFGGDDVKGWIYKCEQFFKVDNVPDEQKVPLISIHLFDIALMWHRQFMRLWERDCTLFKGITLSVAYSLSKLQIETNEATKKKNKAPLFPTPKFNSYTSGGSQISSPKPLALPAPNVNWRTTAATHHKWNQLTNVNWAIRYINRSVFLDEEESQEEEEIVFGTEGETSQLHQIFAEGPQISLHALNGIQSYQTLRVIGETFLANMMTLSLGGCDMVLGVQWLSTLGDIQFNFQHLKMVFDYKGKTLILRGTTKPVAQWMSGKQAAKTGNQASNLAMCVYPTAMLNMLSASVPTTENFGMPNTPSVLDPLIEEFADVFERYKGIDKVLSLLGGYGLRRRMGVGISLLSKPEGHDEFGSDSPWADSRRSKAILSLRSDCNEWVGGIVG